MLMNFCCKLTVLFGSWQLSEQYQKGHFQEISPFSKNFNGIASILENALISVNEGDFGGTGDGVHVSRIVAPEYFAFVNNFLEVGRFDEGFADGEFVGFVVSGVGDGE